MTESSQADPAVEVVSLLIQCCLTLAVSETDTGGLIASTIRDVPGCSAVFLGSDTPYHNRAKER